MKNIIKTILILILAAFMLVSSSCTYEELGLPVPEDSGTVTGTPGDNIGSDLTEEEFFLEMKARQNRNLLSDINVRKAIMHAVDRERIIEEIFGSYNTVSNSLFSQDSAYWHPAWSVYDFDLDRASEYMEKAGFGPENPLYITIRTVDNSSSRRLIEEIIREDLSKIGVNLWIYNDPPKDFYQNHIYIGSFDLAIWSLYVFDGKEIQCSFSSSKIPSMETEENKNCVNFYWYSSSNMDDVLKKLSGSDDVDLIKEKTAQIQDILANDSVILPLYSRLFVFAHNDRISDAGLEILENQVYFDIERWQHGSSGQDMQEEQVKEIVVGYESETIDILEGFQPFFLNHLLFRGLWKKTNHGSFIPEMAESYSIYGDEPGGEKGNGVIIELKHDVYWSDGSPVTSGDVKYTFEYFRGFIQNMEYYSALDEDHLKIEDIEIINEKSFKILFTEPVKEWQKLFPMIFQKDNLSQNTYDNILYTSLITNGPYRITAYDESGSLTLEANEYFQMTPDIEKLVIRSDPDIHNLIAMLREGSIDFLSIPVDHELMHDLEQEGLELIIKEGNLIEHLALSLKPKEE